MKVEIKSLTDEAIGARDERDILEIFIDGEREFSVHDGESEDATLSRDFNDCYEIGNLMQRAYNTGKEGGSFILSKIQVDEL